LKIAHVCARYPPFFGGVETHVKNVAENMVARGHKVFVYTTDATRKLPPMNIQNGVVVNRFHAFAPNEFYYFSFSLFRALRNIEVDIIHGHGLQAFPFLAATLARRSQKCVVTLHSGETSSLLRKLLHVPYYRFVLHNSLKKTVRIICVSEYEMKIFPRIFRLPLTRFVCIPNGTSFADVEEEQENNTASIILSVGRLEKWKGFEDLIRSFAILKRTTRLEDLLLVIVGTGPCKAELTKRVTEEGISDDVFMLENIPTEELAKLYKKCKVFVLLAKGGYPAIAVLDALNMGKPIVTPCLGVLKDYIEKGYVHGVKWPVDPAEVAQKLKIILENPEAFKPRETKLPSWHEVTDRLNALYEETSKHTRN